MSGEVKGLVTAEEVKRQVKADFKRRGVSIKDVADLLGVSADSLRTSLSRYDYYFGGPTAAKLVALYGYTYEFLQAGRGFLYPAGAGGRRPGAPIADAAPERSLVAICADLSAALRELSERVTNLETIVGGGN